MSENPFVLHGYLMMHKAILGDVADYERQAAALRTLGTRDLEKLQARFKFYWAFVEHHHLAEDNGFFPFLAGRDEEFQAALPQLTADHHHIDAVVEEIQGELEQARAAELYAEREAAFRRFMAAVAEYRRSMSAHLEREEGVVVPTVRRHLTVEQQMAAEEGVYASMTPEHMSLMFPWVFAQLDERERAAAYQGLPTPIREGLENGWTKHYQEVVSAFAA